MPYVLKKYNINKSIKIEDFLLDTLKLKEKLALKLLSKGRIIDHKNRRLQKGLIIKDGFIELSIFEPRSKNLKAIFETEHFAIFDKPSPLKVHPVLRSNEYTLLDEIRFFYGDNAQLVHRIDAQTSGLVLVSKNNYAHMILSSMFEEKKFVKKYKALVKNEIKQELLINEKIGKSKGLISIKMEVSKEGKDSSTLIKPIFYNKIKNQTLVEAIPYTGRQHQIRVHLDFINNSIVGDPIYGLDEEFVDKLLKGDILEEKAQKICGAKRLMLHAYYLEFEFFSRVYKISSQQNVLKS